MNSRVIKNLALIAAMGAAFFALNNKALRASTDPACANYCYTQLEYCYNAACNYSSDCPPQPQCQSAYQQCLTTCNN
jgi:hypothetical protein